MDNRLDIRYSLSFVNSVSVPKYRVNANAYHFRPQKRAQLSDLSSDSVALANVSKFIDVVSI